MVFVGSMVAGFAFGQSAFGLRVCLSDIRFFTPNDEDLYYADYAIDASPSIGLSWSLKSADGNLIACTLLRDDLDFQYYARQFIANASFVNASHHQLTRYTIQGARLWNMVSFGSSAIYLGPGLGLIATQVRSSQGEGFDTRLLQWTDTTGNVFTYPGPVYWAYEGRKPEAFHPVYLSGALVLELQIPLSQHWGLDIGAKAELLLTPWLNEERIRFTSNRTFEGHFDIRYWLRRSTPPNSRDSKLAPTNH